MSDTGSSLVAVTEKKLHKPGGCVGIFFQLFHWNHRFVKKNKLFAKKLLTPAGLKQVSKKSGSDDKLPKFTLIADTNIEVPGMKRNGTLIPDCELRPGLVARLMGLDSMPAVQSDKLKKTYFSKFVKLSTKYELRPQKMGALDRCAATRFEAQAAKSRNTLSRARKCNQKLDSPLKSLSGRNAYKLIGPANRILGPGSQSKNRVKCARPYSSKMDHTRTDKVRTEANKASTDGLLESSYFTNVSRSFSGPSSCRSCNNLLDIVESRQILVQQPSVSHYVNHSSQGLNIIRSRSMSPLEADNDFFFQKSEEKSTTFAAQSIHNVLPQTESLSNRTCLRKDVQNRWQLTSQQSENRYNSNYSMSYELKFPSQNQVSVVRDIMSPRSNLSNLMRNKITWAVDKDSIGLNRISSDQASSRMNVKVDTRKHAERNTSGKLDYFVPSAHAGFSSSGKQIHSNPDAMVEKIVGGNVQSRNCTRNKCTCMDDNNAVDSVNRDDNVIPFICSSPVKQEVEIPEETNDRRDEDDSIGTSNTGHTLYTEKLPLRGDASGTHLEQKLKELLRQECDDLTSENISLERTSSMIWPLHQDDMVVGPYVRNDSSCFAQTSNALPRFQKIRAPQNDSNNSLSPVSVLEVPVSNDSNFSGSLDNTSAYLHPAGLMDRSYIKQKKIELNFDSAISPNKESHGQVLVILNHTREMLCRIDIVGSRLEGTKLDHAKEVILNTELLFGSAVQHDLDETKGFSISHFLTHELETLASILLTSSGCLIGFEEKKRNSLQGFLFDCIIEYIDSRYSPCFMYGNKLSRNLTSCMNTRMLIKEVDNVIRSWRGSACLMSDELIEREMSCCLQKSFEKEAFETSSEIDENIFQFLMNEIIIDLSQTKLEFPNCGRSSCF